MSDSPPRTTRLLSRALVSLSVAALLSIGLLAGCSERRPERAAPSAVAAEPRAKSRAKPQLTHRQAPAAPLEQFVQQHVEEADATGMRVLVYVGASWCGPCQRFHKALASGELDEALAGTKFLAFDA